MTLLERFCTPGVRAQGGGFRWIVLADAATPPSILQRLRAAAPAETVLLEAPHALEDLQRAVGAARREPAARLLTTRLDSDDVLVAGHMARVRRAAATTADGTFLNTPLGYQWTAADGRLRWVLDPSNPFISHVEGLVGPSAVPHTAYRTAHPWASRVAPVRQVLGPPAWLHVLHDVNGWTGSHGLPVPRRGLPRGLRDHPGLHADGARDLRAFLAAAPAYVRRERGSVRTVVRELRTGRGRT